MTSDTERWKQKYFDKLEEFEAQESSFKDQVHTLERLVVRVSLAAQGLDSGLDRELDQLRSIVRQESASKGQLDQALGRIEKSVLSLDESRESTSTGVLKALSDLVEQLQALGLSRPVRKALKKFSRQLESRVQDLRHYPGLLAEFARLQRDSLSELVAHQAGQEQGGGLFSRLFGSRDVAEEKLAPATRSDTDITQADDAEDEEDAARGDHYTLEVEQGAQKSSENGPFEPGFSAIADHVVSTLTYLVEQLNLPDTLQGEAGKVTEKLQTGLNWYELVPTLDDIANLVIAAFGRGQREFESFLKSLDDRLVTIQQFLEISAASQSASRENNAELQNTVREQVSSLQESMQSAKDINTLKLSVSSNLDVILESLANFMRKETERETDLESEMQLLHERLRGMEEESREIQEKLLEEQRKSTTDILTGLPNRASYETRVQQEYERWKRYGNPLTMVVVDIDRFKSINDNYGHLAGDKVIQLVAKEIARRIRKTDYIARYGGEEFVILLPETELNTATAVMEKTREMVSRLPFHFRSERVQITVSMGVCAFAGSMTIQGVFEQADKALYRAKNGGRNRVESAVGDTETD